MTQYVIDPQLVDFVAQWEGFSAKKYNDPAGNCTAGYGHLLHLGPCNGSPSEAGWDNLTEAEGKRRHLRQVVY